MIPRTCNQTRVVRSEIVVPRHLNDKDTLYGGDIMAHFDSAGGSAVYKFIHKPSFTATIDTFVFVNPVRKGAGIYIESYVSGAGKTSVEAFVKLVATDLKTFEKKICAYAFLTYVLEDRNDPEFEMPTLKPESQEEIAICADYAERRQVNLEKREMNKSLIGNISVNAIWEQE